MRKGLLKYGLIALGGVVVGAAITQKKGCLREAGTKILGGAISVVDKAMVAIETFKESAEDFYADAKEQSKDFDCCCNKETEKTEA